MDFERRLEDALTSVYAAMGDHPIERTLKDIAGQLSLEYVASINDTLDQHFSTTSLHNNRSK